MTLAHRPGLSNIIASLGHLVHFFPNVFLIRKEQSGQLRGSNSAMYFIQL